MAEKGESTTTGNNEKPMLLSEILSLRSDYRNDIRSLDDLNFKIITSVSTISFAIITAGIALKNPDIIFFFFGAIALVNSMAIKMLLKNRISVLEKTWYVYHLESNFPMEQRQFSPFGFKIFNEALPKGSAYPFMINVHNVLVYIGLGWAAVFLLFVEWSAQMYSDFIAGIISLCGKSPVEPSILSPLNQVIPFIVLIIFFIAFLWDRHKIFEDFKERWNECIWVKKPELLDAIKQRFKFD